MTGKNIPFGRVQTAPYFKYFEQFVNKQETHANHQKWLVCPA
jgi:hypothetical protein